MAIFNELNFAPLYDFFTKIWLFLERPSVRLQLMAILLAILLAWLLEKILESRLQKQQLQFPHYLATHSQRFFIILNYLKLPLFGLLAIWINQQMLLSQGALTGLLTHIQQPHK
ncbi:MAG: hypothetical protein AB4368_06710 [Xenococcaceae cyanobacterium]